jgi:iron complex outermembrane receptor protein
MDYWNYTVSDSIGPTGEEVIFGNPGQYAAQFVRCGSLTAPEQAALVSTCGGGASPNTLAYISNTQLNLGKYKTDGIDITSNWRGAASAAGQFSVDYKGTYILSYKYQLEKYAAYNDNLGLYFNGNPVAQYRHLLNFGWQYGAWATQLAHRFSSGYTDQELNENGDLRHVASNSIFDLAVTWSGLKGTTLTAGVSNLLNTDPPFSNQSGGFQVGYDYRYGNPLGRSFLLRGTYQF